MQAFSSYFSLAVSIGTAITTCLFWVLKANRERARLKIYSADGDIRGWAQSSCGDPIKLSFDAKTIVANYSTLPNAILGAHAAVLMKDGSWHPAEAKIDPKTPLPLNLAPLHTVKLDVSLTLSLPAVPEGDACKNTHETYALYRDLFLAQPLQVKVSLTTLGDKHFSNVLHGATTAAKAQSVVLKAA